jgi:hypothetical protein
MKLPIKKLYATKRMRSDVCLTCPALECGLIQLRTKGSETIAKDVR